MSELAQAAEQLIASLGFPIVVALALGWGFYRLLERRETEHKQDREVFWKNSQEQHNAMVSQLKEADSERRAAISTLGTIQGVLNDMWIAIQRSNGKRG